MQYFILLFMPLLTTPVVINSYLLSEISSIFLKKHTIPNLEGFQFEDEKFEDLNENKGKSSYQARYL